MGLGASALNTNAKKEIPVPPGPPAPPFDPSSADNGLSVDAISGKIVLGNDFGDPAAPAQLLSDREIIMDDSGGNPWAIYLQSTVNAVLTALTGDTVTVVGQNGTAPSIVASGGANSNIDIRASGGNNSSAGITARAISGTSTLDMICGNDSLQWFVDGSGLILFGISDFGLPITIMSFNTTALTMQIGATQVASNGANVQVAGTLNRRYLQRSQGAGTYNVDRDTDSDLIHFNTAAATFNLPNMAGSNDRPGYIFRVLVQNAAGVTVQTDGTQVIRLGTLFSSAGGTISSVSVGSCVTLIWNGVTGGWVAESFTGVWNFT